MTRKLATLAALALATLAFGGLKAASAEAGDDTFKVYLNARFGYHMEYPEIFSRVVEPENGDGLSLTSTNEQYSLAMWGAYNVLDDDGASLLARRLESVAHIVEGSAAGGEDFYRLAWSDNGGRDGVEHIFHEYGRVNYEMMAAFTFSYPAGDGERSRAVISRMESSLSLPKVEK